MCKSVPVTQEMEEALFFPVDMEKLLSDSTA